MSSLADSVKKYGGLTYAYGWLSSAVETFLREGDAEKLRRRFDEIEAALREAGLAGKERES